MSERRLAKTGHGAIRVLVVDDVPDARQSIKRLLEFERDVEVVGEAADGIEALEAARALSPDCVLMDVNMPKADGIVATERMSRELPEALVVMMSVQGEQEYLRRAMAAGARDYLIKPFTGDDLVRTVKRVYATERTRLSNSLSSLTRAAGGGRLPDGLRIAERAPAAIVPFFSPKGGVGKTTLAVNTAVSLARDFGKRVAIVDLDLEFGDVAILLGIEPRRTISDLSRDAREGASLDAEAVRDILVEHGSGVLALCGPTRPEEAELIAPSHVGTILEVLKGEVDIVVIDTPPALHETVLTALDHAADIFLVSSIDVPTLKNVRLAVDLMDSLGYGREAIRLVLNRTDDGARLGPGIAERHLSMRAAVDIPSDGRTVGQAANNGVPFVSANRRRPISKKVKALAEIVAESGARSSADIPDAAVAVRG